MHLIGCLKIALKQEFTEIRQPKRKTFNFINETIQKSSLKYTVQIHFKFSIVLNVKCEFLQKYFVIFWLILFMIYAK